MNIETNEHRTFFRVFLVITLAVTVGLLDFVSPASIGWGFLYLGPVVASAYFFGWWGGVAMIPICLGSYHWIGMTKQAMAGLSFHPGNTWLELGGMIAANAFTSSLVRVNDDLQRAKQTLEANLKQKEIIFQSTAGGLLLVGRDLSLLDINPTAEKLMGVPFQETRHQPIHQADVDPAVQRFFQGLATQSGPVVSERFSVSRPEPRTLEVTATRIESQDGNPTHPAWAVAVQDLTDLVHAHEVLLSKAHTLAVQDTRNRMARDLHDNLAQTLATVHMRLGLLREASLNPDQKVQQLWDRVEEILIRVLKDVRQNIWELRPTALEHADFVSALRMYISEMGSMGRLKGELKVEGPVQLDPDREVLLFYVIQEAITNAQKHSGAEHVVVELVGRDHALDVTIGDDGKGFDPDEQQNRPLRKSYGLTSMQERVNLMGGRFDVQSAPGQGTQVHLMVPVKKSTEELNVVSNATKN